MTSLFSQEYATKAYVAEISAKVRADSLAEGKAEGTAKAYYDMVHKNLLPINIAAAELDQSEEEFKANMERYFSE